SWVDTDHKRMARVCRMVYRLSPGAHAKSRAASHARAVARIWKVLVVWASFFTLERFHRISESHGGAQQGLRNPGQTQLFEAQIVCHCGDASRRGFSPWLVRALERGPFFHAVNPQRLWKPGVVSPSMEDGTRASEPRDALARRRPDQFCSTGTNPFL